MNFLRHIINISYPFRMHVSRLTGIGIRIVKNDNYVKPIENIYSLKAILNTGEEINFEAFRNRKILIVNLASKCGYTPQYEELQKLYTENESLVILGFPSNNFGEQEPGNDDAINNFCKINFGVTFPLFKKNDVKGKNKQAVYQWLTDKNKNGWNDNEPQWNFYKYLIDEKGILVRMYSSSVAPARISL